jgi:hypothetical protein
MNKLVEILVEAVVKEGRRRRRLTMSGRTAKSYDETVGAGVPGM